MDVEANKYSDNAPSSAPASRSAHPERDVHAGWLIHFGIPLAKDAKEPDGQIRR